MSSVNAVVRSDFCPSAVNRRSKKGGICKRHRLRVSPAGIMENKNLSLSIVWFRIGDLRVHDHEPFHQGCSSDSHVLPFFYAKRKKKGNQDVFSCSESRQRAIEKALKCLTYKIESYGASLVVPESHEELDEFRKRVVEQINSVPYAEVRLHYYASINLFLDSQQYEEEQTVLQILDGLVDSVHLAWGRTLLHPNCILSSDSQSGFTKCISPESDTRRISGIDSNSSFMTEDLIKYILQLKTMTAFRADVAKTPVQEPCDMSKITVQCPSLFQQEMRSSQEYKYKIHPAVQDEGRATTETHVAFFADEDEALERLDFILTKPGFMEGYRESRMLASIGDNSAMLSTALSVGSLSPRMFYAKAMASLNAKRPGTRCNWLKELEKNGPGEAWLIMHLVIRDFFMFSSECHGSDLLAQHGPAKRTIAWEQDEELFKAWVQGRTGFPFIDANMRQLAATGYISNRGRQNVASFLAKELSIDWRWGAEHFRNTLVDHEPAINLESWAYVSGVGSDPRDRKFLSVTQGEKYDPDGTLIARWLPELAQLSAQDMHRPWSYKGEINYPDAIVDPANQIGRYV
eukprot:jgi/Picsp_1/2306/NSC_05770-R1_dna photolyase